jgi:hypothetical protein
MREIRMDELPNYVELLAMPYLGKTQSTRMANALLTVLTKRGMTNEEVQQVYVSWQAELEELNTDARAAFFQN